MRRPHRPSRQPHGVTLLGGTVTAFQRPVTRPLVSHRACHEQAQCAMTARSTSPGRPRWHPVGGGWMCHRGRVTWPWEREPAIAPDPHDPVATSVLAATGKPVMVLGRAPLDPSEPADDQGALFVHPRADEGRAELTVCHCGHLIEVDDSLRTLPAPRPGDVPFRAQEGARWVQRRFRTVTDLDAWMADPVG